MLNLIQNSIKFNKLLESKEFTIIKQVNGEVELSDIQNLNAKLNFVHETSNLELSITEQPKKGKILNILIDNINTENLKNFGQIILKFQLGIGLIKI